MSGTRSVIDRIVGEYTAQKLKQLRTACGFMGITDDFAF